MSNLSMKLGSCTNMFINETSALNSNQTKKIVHGFDIEYHPALIMIAVLVIISNMFVIVLFVTKETLRKGGKLLLLSLAISDVMTGLVIIPLNIGCEDVFAKTLHFIWNSESLPSHFHSIPYIGDNIRDVLRHPSANGAPRQSRKAESPVHSIRYLVRCAACRRNATNVDHWCLN